MIARILDRAVASRLHPPRRGAPSLASSVVEELLRAVKVKKRMKGYYRFDPAAGREVWVPEREFMGTLWEEEPPEEQKKAPRPAISRQAKVAPKEEPGSLWEEAEIAAPKKSPKQVPQEKPQLSLFDEAALSPVDVALRERLAPKEKPEGAVPTLGKKEPSLPPSGSEDAPVRRVGIRVAKKRLEEPAPPEPAATAAAELRGYSPAGLSKGGRLEANRTAVELAERLIEENARPTDEEREVLARYSGEGGAGDSLNEFYTAPAVAVSLWHLLEKAGFSGGPVLEPSCGAGVFLRSAPPEAKMTGVELSPEAAKVAGLLHPDAEVLQGSLEEFAANDGRRWKAIIGNPPYGPRGRLRGADRPELAKAEDYFISAALDLADDGALIGLVLPHGIMSGGGHQGLRATIHRQAELVVAHRLPISAFGHSHVDVTTDLVVLRKRPQETANALAAASDETLLHLGLWNQEHQEFVGGTYFDGHGEHVHGTATDGGNFGSLRVVGEMTSEVYQAIRDSKLTAPKKQPDIEKILTAASGDPDEQSAIRKAVTRQPYQRYTVGETKSINGRTYILNRNHRWERLEEVEGTEGANAVKGSLADAVLLRDQLKELLAARQRGDQLTARMLQRDTREALQRFVADYGNPHEIAEIQDKLTELNLHPLLAAYGPGGQLSDLLTQLAALAPKADVDRKDLDGVLRSFGEEARTFSLDQLVEVYEGDLDREAITNRLLHSDEWAIGVDGRWQHRSDWLTGNLFQLREGLDWQIDSEQSYPIKAKLERQREWLTKETTPIPLEDIEITFRSGWVPFDVLSAFLREDEVFGRYRRGDIEVQLENGEFKIHGMSDHNMKPMWKYLNRTAMSDQQRQSIAAGEERYRAWLQTSGHRQRLEDLYAQHFNSWREKRYSGDSLDLDGQNPKIVLHHYQNAAVNRMLEEGSGILAHDVGLGKTYAGLVLAMALKQRGKARKPMVVVPKSVLVNWIEEATKLFPDAKIQVIGATYNDKRGMWVEDSAEQKEAKLHQTAQNDYDFVLTTQPLLGSIQMDPDRLKAYQESDFWTQRAKSLEGAASKRIAKIEAEYEGQVAARETAKKGAASFEDLGVDALIMDELHAYKNLYSARSRDGGQPKFLGAGAESKRALDLAYKSKFIRESNDGRNVYGLTATPTKNSPLEIYSLLSYVAPEAFAALGIRNSEEFIDRYCQLENRLVIRPKAVEPGGEEEGSEHDLTNGELVEAPCVVGFKNLNEIRPILARYVERRTAGDVGLEIPKPEVKQHTFDMDEEQSLMYDLLRQQLEESREAGRSAQGEAHIFSILSRMEKATMDLELLGSEHVGHGDRAPKYRMVAEGAAEPYRQGRGQVIFSDKNESHGKIKQHLIRAGIPESEIGIINGQVTKQVAARQRVANDYNSGKLRVVIGNTATMGEGLNLQTDTGDIHHLDLPWEPAAVQQRTGRGVRQGNKLESVRIHYYLGKASFDFYRHQMITGKQAWIDSLWSGGNHVENQAIHGALSADDLLILGAADPEAARAQLAANRAKREEEYKGRQTAKASADFATHLETKKKLRLLDPSTETYRRLQERAERQHASLSRNPHFRQKEHLDAQHSLILHEQSGLVFHEGMGFELAGGNNGVSYRGPDPTNWLVTKVMPQSNTIEVRQYGAPDKKETVQIDSKADLASIITPKSFDLAREPEEIAARAPSPSALTSLPPAAIRSQEERIQQNLRVQHKANRWAQWPIEVAGEVTVPKNAGDIPSGAKYVLPLPENRGKLAEAAKRWYQEALSTEDHDERRRLEGAGRTVRALLTSWYGAEVGRAAVPISEGGTWDAPSQPAPPPKESWTISFGSSAISKVAVEVPTGDRESPATVPEVSARTLDAAIRGLRSNPPRPEDHGQRSEYERRTFRSGLSWAADKVGSFAGRYDIEQARNLIAVGRAKQARASRAQQPFWDGVLIGAKRILGTLEG